MGNLPDIYREVGSMLKTAMKNVSAKTGLDVLPERVIIVPQAYLPKGVIAGVHEAYDGVKTMIASAEKLYAMKYKELEGIMVHELSHLFEMGGKKLSIIARKFGISKNVYQDALFDAEFATTEANEGKINAFSKYVAKKAGYATNILDAAYKEATKYVDGLMRACAKIPDTPENIYREVRCGRPCRSGC